MGNQPHATFPGVEGTKWSASPAGSALRISGVDGFACGLPLSPSGAPQAAARTAISNGPRQRPGHRRRDDTGPRWLLRLRTRIRVARISDSPLSGTWRTAHVPLATDRPRIKRVAARRADFPGISTGAHNPGFPQRRTDVFDTSDPRLYLFTALAIIALMFVYHWVSSARATAGDGSGRGGTRGKPNLFEVAVGFGTNFFDTLGIGSFAPTTSLYKLAKTVPDDEIPGTMMTGHTPPVIIQAFIFMTIILVEPLTLFTLIAAAVLGAWLGAGVVTRLPRHWIQIGMGVALLIAAVTFLRSIFGT
ncbi:MAG: sulfite exporter TauE/SafE family protein, partial [Acidobacteria bacterium]|nr:sulfite exporter TauE/SafE family protein [Acidobacteriota bacterium]